jgi:hypothetical protein
VGAQQTFTITVNPSTTITPPQPIAVCAGQDATFSVTANGTGPFTYEWRNYGTSGASFTVVGTNSPTLTLTGVTSGMNGNRYAVQATGACGVVLYQYAVLTVNPNPTVSVNLCQCRVGNNNSYASAGRNFYLCVDGAFGSNQSRQCCQL